MSRNENQNKGLPNTHQHQGGFDLILWIKQNKEKKTKENLNYSLREIGLKSIKNNS